jgi:hypothetical protein
MNRRSAWLVALLSCWLAPLAGPAADEVGTPQPSQTAPADAAATPATPAADVYALVEQLGAPEFAERQEAVRKLTEAGRGVFPQVEKAAEAGSREVATRAVEILRRHYDGGDLDTKDAARAALERLAKSGNPTAAQRAGEVLNPPSVATIPQQAIGGINPAILQQLQQRGIQIQVGGIAPAQNIVRRTSIRTVNGLREIEHQNGEKITKVKDVAGGGIEAEVTEKVNGKETTRKIEAKDLDDLKKKDADVAQIYETYNRGPRGIQVGAALPAGVPAARPPETVKRMIESIDRSIERYKAQLPNDPTAQQRIDSLERTKKRYQDMLPKEEAKPAENSR